MREFIRLIKMWFAAKAKKAKWEAELVHAECLLIKARAVAECGVFPAEE